MQPAQLGAFPHTPARQGTFPHFPHREQSMHPVLSQHLPLRSGQAPAGLPVHLRRGRWLEDQGLPSGPCLHPPAPAGQVARGQLATGLGFSGSPREEMEEFGQGAWHTASGFQLPGSTPLKKSAAACGALATNRFGRAWPPYKGLLTPCIGSFGSSSAVLAQQQWVTISNLHFNTFQ